MAEARGRVMDLGGLGQVPWDTLTPWKKQVLHERLLSYWLFPSNDDWRHAHKLALSKLRLDRIQDGQAGSHVLMRERREERAFFEKLRDEDEIESFDAVFDAVLSAYRSAVIAAELTQVLAGIHQVKRFKRRATINVAMNIIRSGVIPQPLDVRNALLRKISASIEALPDHMLEALLQAKSRLRPVSRKTDKIQRAWQDAKNGAHLLAPLIAVSSSNAVTPKTLRVGDHLRRYLSLALGYQSFLTGTTPRGGRRPFVEPAEQWVFPPGLSAGIAATPAEKLPGLSALGSSLLKDAQKIGFDRAISNALEKQRNRENLGRGITTPRSP